MIKASLLLMLGLTVLVWFGLRWREAQAAPPAPSPRPGSAGRRMPRPPGLIARGKAGIDRWVTAAAIAAVATIVLLGGLHWLRVFQQ